MTMDLELVDIWDIDLECADLLRYYVTNIMIEDERLMIISTAFLQIAETYNAYDNQHTRILNIIQHALVDYKDKPYKYI